MNGRLLGLGVVVAAIFLGCSSTDSGGSTSSSGGSGTTSGSSTSSSSGAAEADAGGTTPKGPGPTLTAVMKMTGGLHVMWDLPKTCDGVELERKDGDATYAVKYTLPGTVDNKHDATATADVVYSYRARCKVGADHTEYSNEMSKNPKQ